MHLEQSLTSLVIIASITCLSTDGAWAQEGGVPNTGTLVVVNKRANAVNLIDLGTQEIVATLPTGNGPHEVVVSSDGRTAVVTNYGGSGAGGRSLTVVDVENARVEKTIDLGEYTRPHGIQFLPGDSLVAVTSESTHFVVLANVIAGSVSRALPTEHPGSHMLAATSSGAYVYTGNMGDGTVSKIDAVGGTVERTYRVPAQPEAITVTPDGAEVWVGSNAEGTVNVLNTETGEVDSALRGFGWPYRILITPDQNHVLIPDLRRNQLRFVDRESRRVIDVLDVPGGPQGITLSLDLQSAFLALSQRDEVAVIDLATRTIVGRIPTGRGPDGLAHSSITTRR